MTILNSIEQLTSTDKDIINGFLDDKSVSDLAEEYNVNCLMIEDILRQIFTKVIDEFNESNAMVSVYSEKILDLQMELSNKKRNIEQLKVQRKIGVKNYDLLME